MEYITDQTFQKNDTGDKPLSKAEYEGCKFVDCDFSNADLSGFIFTDCEFKGCNLSLSKLKSTSIRDVRFMQCKMLGLQFNTCNEFGLAFSLTGCNLANSSFYKTRLKKSIFRETSFHECDFTECDLSSSTFDKCDFANANFEKTNLEKCDFRSSLNYIIDPDNNMIKKASFSSSGIAGLLVKYDINID